MHQKTQLPPDTRDAIDFPLVSFHPSCFHRAEEITAFLLRSEHNYAICIMAVAKVLLSREEKKGLET